MGILGNISIMGGLLFLSACGEPLKQTDVKSKYSGYTVSKLTNEQRYARLGPNDPSLGTRYIYHASDGRAYYFKETPKGYRRREAGRWWAGENKICYSMRVTRAEDVEGDQCAPAGTDVLWSSFKKGDTKGLVPKRSTTRRRSGSDAGFGYDKVLTGLAALVVGATAVAVVADKVCGSGGCPTDGAQSVPSNSNGKKYQCTISCTNSGFDSATGLVGDSLRKIYVNLPAVSSYEAKKLAEQNSGPLCRKANLQSFAGASISCK